MSSSSAASSIHTTKLGQALAPTASAVGGYLRGELSNLISIVEGNGSRTLVDFIRRVAESSTLTEELAIVEDELRRCRSELAHESQPTDYTVREIVLRLVFCELLGYAAPFAYIAAMKLAGSSSLRCKQVGYLACRLFLRRNNELVIE